TCAQYGAIDRGRPSATVLDAVLSGTGRTCARYGTVVELLNRDGFQMLAQSSLYKFIFGRLTLDAFPIHEPILVGTFLVVATGGIAVFGAITYFRLWGYLWREWFTSVDHKRIGVMYIVLGVVMLLRGFADALMMRTQQALAFGSSQGFLPAHHYDQIFTAHGVIMIFFVAMPLVTGLMNYVVPLQI